MGKGCTVVQQWYKHQPKSTWKAIGRSIVQNWTDFTRSVHVFHHRVSGALPNSGHDVIKLEKGDTGNECPDHPHRRKMRSGIDCFTDDDFSLVDEHLIKNVHKTLDDEKGDTKDLIFVKGSEDEGIKQELCNDFEQKAIPMTTPVKTKTVGNRRSTAKSVSVRVSDEEKLFLQMLRKLWLPKWFR
ncbi:hypothetical protein Aduo_006366 [Ancylostoma duodenale]